MPWSCEKCKYSQNQQAAPVRPSPTSDQTSHAFCDEKELLRVNLSTQNKVKMMPSMDHSGSHIVNSFVDPPLDIRIPQSHHIVISKMSRWEIDSVLFLIAAVNSFGPSWKEILELGVENNQFAMD
ncbi:hypothetical protein Ae201684P_007676 [Aphanomyces euteiches]|nr:hypothetical protein Ae201684P_007676 [Aphanomyces euteiches]KAH9141065.1 hypothetical protein AeRB84_014726 [Aphanomyces euteiches]